MGGIILPKYAYIPIHADYQLRNSNTEIDEFENRRVLKIDSTKISKEEYDFLRKQLNDYCYCYACDSRMKLRKPSGKHQHFAHNSRKNCFEAESLAHASVKRNLYERFKKRGYKVALERSFKSLNKQLYTDVAVMEQTDILAIEVQASPTIKLSTIAERTTTYADSGIPTAWVIVLDTFFGKGNFTTTKQQVLVQHADGTSSYEEKLLPYSESTPFIVTSEIPKSFLFIMDHYKYVIAVNYDGHFFMIRRTEITGNVFQIYRIEQGKVVDSLLETDITRIDYKSENKNHDNPLHELKHTDGEHNVGDWEEDFILEGERLLGIDFRKAYLEEQEQLKHDTALNILEIIRETKRRELLHAKKLGLLESYNRQINELISERSRILSIIQDMNHQLQKQFQQIEENIHKEEKEKEAEKERARQAAAEEQRLKEQKKHEEESRVREDKRQQEEREYNRLLELEEEKELEEYNKRVEVLNKARLEMDKKQEQEERAIKSLLAYVQEYLESLSLEELYRLYTPVPPYLKENIYYFSFEYVKTKVTDTLYYHAFRRSLAKDIDILFDQAVLHKQNEAEIPDKEPVEQDEWMKESKRIKKELAASSVEKVLVKETVDNQFERQEKDRLCTQIESMQKSAGFTIVRNVHHLREATLKEVKEAYDNVNKHYARLTQLSFF
jgi:hypothetical protein